MWSLLEHSKGVFLFMQNLIMCFDEMYLVLEILRVLRLWLW